MGIIQLRVIQDDSVLGIQNLLKPDTTPGQSVWLTLGVASARVWLSRWRQSIHRAATSQTLSAILDPSETKGQSWEYP